MIQGDAGGDPFEQLVDQPVVEVQPASLTRPVPSGITRGQAIENRTESRPSSRISAMSSGKRRQKS